MSDDRPTPGGGLTPASRRVLDLLGATPATAGALAAASGDPVPVVLAAVADLTARGYARATPGGVVRTHG